MDITSIWPGSLVNEAFKIVEILELNFGNGNTCTIFTIFRSFKIGKQNLSSLHGRKIEYSATSIPRNTGRNIGNIRGYSEVFSILNDLNIVRIVLFLRPKLSSYISATLNAPFTKLSGQIEITFSYVRAELPAVKVTRSFFNYPLLFLITRSFYPRPATRSK